MSAVAKRAFMRIAVPAVLCISIVRRGAISELSKLEKPYTLYMITYEENIGPSQTDITFTLDIQPTDHGLTGNDFLKVQNAITNTTKYSNVNIVTT